MRPNDSPVRIDAGLDAHLPLFNLMAEDRAILARIGPVWGEDVAKHRDISASIYAKLHERAPKEGITVERDLPYGSHARQVVDVFLPPAAQRSGAVMVFVHGGAFVRGDKSQPGGVYDNILYYFARYGMIGVNVEYRLGNEATEPGGALDVRDALGWVRANVGSRGGDPSRIYLFGHSAGGTHVATYALDPRVRPAGGHGLAGLILLSARLSADVLPDNPNREPVRTYFGPDESSYAARSPMAHAANADMPLFIGVAEYDNPHLDRYGVEFAARVAAAGRRMPRLVRMTRHNHFTIAAHLNTEEDFLGGELRDFIARGR